MKKTLTAILVVAAMFFATPDRSSAFVPEALLIFDTGKRVYDFFKKKSDKEVEKSEEIRKCQEIVVSKQAAKGRQVTFGGLYEKVIISDKAIVITFEATISGNPTAISLLFFKEGEVQKFTGSLYWDNIEEYEANSSKRTLGAYYVKYGYNIGPIDDEAETPTPAPSPTDEAVGPTVP